MQLTSLQKKISILLLVFVLFLYNSQYISMAYAASMSFYNYSTGSTQNYTGKQVIYTYNSRKLPLSYPGIIIDGTALADYEELFVRELGLQAERNGDTITISDGVTEVVLTLGSKTVFVNGKPGKTNVAPVKLKFDDTIKYYVPTRFVAESFGFSYVWVSSINTVKITKTLSLSENNKNFNYNRTLYAVKYQDKIIYTDMPVIYYNGSVVVPAKQIFEAAGCFYQETENSIEIKKNELSLTLNPDVKSAYINGKKIIADLVPMRIKDNISGTEALYVALEFVADMLGFGLTYSDETCCFELKETELTGCLALYPDLQGSLWAQKPIETENCIGEQPDKKMYFEWTAAENLNAEEKYLSKVAAYALEEADVVELYGITRNDINDFFDNGFIIFELKDVHANMDSPFFYDYPAPHMTFALITETGSGTKLIFMIPAEDEWQFVEQEECVRVFFSRADLSLEDLQITSISSDFATEEEITSPYPDDKIIIPLPENVEISHISDKDDYLNHNFVISISGNYEKFIKENPILNPYYYVVKYDILYNSTTKKTEITFTTKSVCGYIYEVEHNYLSVSVGKPEDFYSKIIVLDAGHGGIDPGAIKNGIYEKNLNFTILNTYAKELFENSDIKVYFTRDTDVKIDLYDRAAFASDVGADLFISLHMNSNSTGSVNGTQVYYSSDNNTPLENGLNSYKLAKALVNTISSSINTKNRGVTNSEFVVVKYNTVPAVLIELGFMTNEKDLSKLTNTEYQKKAAKAIYQTVLEIYSDYLFR